MKKALVVLLALACVSALAFADGTTAKWSLSNLYGFGVFMPSTSGASTLLEGYDYSNVGGSRTRLTFNLTAADGNVGFNSRMQVTANAGSYSVPVTIPAGITLPVTLTSSVSGFGFNQLNGWAKAFGGMLTVRAGVLDDYTIATTDWQTFGTTDGSTGIYFDVAPIPGLDVGFFQAIPKAAQSANMNGDIVGFAFAMPNLVSVQGGLKLDNTVSAGAGNQIYFGANLKAVPNLTAILEGDVMLANGGTLILLEQNVGYAMGALTVGARIGEYNDGIASKLDWGLEPTVTYKVNDNIAANVIVNVYSINHGSNPITGGSGSTAVAFMGPVDGWAGAIPQGPVDGTMIFGGGAFVTYTVGGFTLTVGDYYGADKSQGNLFFVNADVSL